MIIFSIIVPFLNEEKYIAKCITSLLKQNFPKDKYEIIFVDNGSTDNSLSIVKKKSSIIILHEKNKNVYAARNKALHLAKGKYVAFTDADCIVNKDWLQSILKGFSEKDTGILIGERFFKTNKKSLKLLALFENNKTKTVTEKYSIVYQYGYTNNMALIRKDIQKVKQFSIYKTSGDVDIVQKILKLPNKKIKFNTNQKIIHLEINSVFDWIKKYYIYGKDQQTLTARSGQKTLSSIQNSKIFLSLIIKEKLNFYKSLLLLSILLIKSLAFKIGSFRK